MTIYDILLPYLPTDSSKQMRATEVVEKTVKNGFSPKTVLDFGCGVGTSKGYFKKVLPRAKWLGVDIEESPEVDARATKSDDMLTYNGTVLPFVDKSFDLVYSNQVMEHVRHPEVVLKEIARVLTPEGLFIGQTSQFEPYHSYSFWNFTIYGFIKICEENGLIVKELRPSIDGITLINRSYLGRPAEYSKWFAEESPLNKEIDDVCAKQMKSHKVRNFRKLIYCGQFAFVCSKK